MFKHKKSLKKRAISPLIATVLLIAFTVALAAVVMNWGRSYIEKTSNEVESKSTTDIKCSTDVKLTFLQIHSYDKICYKYNSTTKNVTLEMIIRNGPNIDLTGVNLAVVGSLNDVYTKSDIISNFKRSAIKKVTVSFNNETIGSIEKVILTPVIRKVGTNTQIECTEKTLEKENIMECS